MNQAQYHAMYRQLRQPGPDDNIGMALVEALHSPIERKLRAEDGQSQGKVSCKVFKH